MQQQSTLNIDDKIENTGPAPDKICSNNYSKLNIDLSNTKWFEPEKLVRLKCVIDLAHKHQMKVSIKPPNDQNYTDYAGRMGLFNNTLVNGEEYKYTYNKLEHELDKFFPLLKIENDHNDTLQNKCLKVIENILGVGFKPFDLSDHFSEIADNVYYHSGKKENSGWGYAQAQAWHGGRIQIAVSDTGVGFLGSYERTNQTKGRKEIDIIVDAFKELESSLNNGIDVKCRGIGLHGVYEYTKEQSGTIEVWSGNSYIKIEGTNEPIKKSLSHKVVGVLFKVSLCLK